MMRKLTGLGLVMALCTVGLAAEQKPRKQVRTRLQGVSKAAITGNPTTLESCAGDIYYNVHTLGAALAGTRVIIDIEGGDEFDPIATAVVLQMGQIAPDGTARTQIQFNDDASPGDSSSRLDFTLQFDANVLFQVGSYDGEFGCYAAKIEVRPPA